MFDKINITRIVKDHFATIKSHDTQKIGRQDIILFLASPFVISAYLIYQKIFLTSSAISILITAFSVFAALLLNLLLLIYDIIKKNAANMGDDSKLKHTFIKEIYCNISFCIFLSILLIVVLLLATLNLRSSLPANQQLLLFLKSIVNFAIYFMVIEFVFTLLMILKRVHVLISKEMDQ